MKKRLSCFVLLLGLSLLGQSSLAQNQKVDAQFFHSLINKPGQLRAIFLRVAGEQKESVLYARFREDLPAFDFRVQLPATAEGFLTAAVRQLPKMRHWARRRDGSVLYKRGCLYRGHLAGARVEYVPHYEDEEQPFVCDAGHLRLVLWSWEKLLAEEQGFEDVLAQVLDRNNVTLSANVNLSKYYLGRPSYFGHVHLYEGQGPEKEEFIALPLTHKVTLNKNILSHTAKAKADRNLCLRLLQPYAPLLSQDERVKLELVPKFVRIKAHRMPESDLAAGQNIYIFLTAGGGINYFDDPWRKERKNIPSPRFIFDQWTAYYERVQLYPSYAIATSGAANSRFAEINEFQGKEACDEGRRRGRPAYMPLGRRSTYWRLLTESLAKYGFDEDSPILEKEGGFDFMGQNFRGNVVNNEMRLAEASYPLYESNALVIPQGEGEKYKAGYATLISTGRALPFISGVHYSDYFIESVDHSDRAMRCAVLETMLRRCRPQLWRMLQRARLRRGDNLSYYFISRKISSLVVKEGQSFFKNEESKKAITLDNERRQRWVEWMAQKRTGVGSGGKANFLRAYKKWRTYLVGESSIASP